MLTGPLRESSREPVGCGLLPPSVAHVCRRTAPWEVQARRAVDDWRWCREVRINQRLWRWYFCLCVVSAVVRYRTGCEREGPGLAGSGASRGRADGHCVRFLPEAAFWVGGRKSYRAATLAA